MCYLDKVFMRQLFSVATGEKDSDADETNPADILGADIAPKKEAAPVDTSIAEKIFMDFVPNCRSLDELKQFWSDNYEARNLLRDNNPEALKRVTAAFTDRKEQIQKGNNNGN
jgi:hypothetical protein